MIDKELVGLLGDRLDAIAGPVRALELMVANVAAGDADDEKYVVLDNLRRMSDAVASAHMALGRFYAAVELVEEQAAAIRSGHSESDRGHVLPKHE